MKLFNTYSNQLEEFIPKVPGQVSIYVCGPTVYNYIHIGNARPVVFFDVLRRYFEAKGYIVKFVSNFTDVDDKIIQKAIDSKKTELEISNFYIEAFLKDVEALGSKTDFLKPRVTEYIDYIINYIKNLVDLGYAYEINGDVYFRVAKLEDYGRLSNRKLDDLLSGARVDVNPDKESPLDFTLWKKTDVGVNWASPFSQGRPGWHTECVAMIDDIFGSEIDIHGGGSDLIFPHHENEIAQAEACHHHHVARYWMHNGRLNLEGEKMSKSIGNVILVKDLEGDKLAFRMLLLSTHYRSPLNFSDENLAMYQTEWNKLENTVRSLFRMIELAEDSSKIEKRYPEIDELLAAFDEAMDFDFNTPNAITAIQSLVKLANIESRKKNNIAVIKQIYEALQYTLEILGLWPQVEPLDESDKQLISMWHKLRAEKKFSEADELRKTLMERNLI
ncbi:MAG: cysteine--tRNA ligase [Bacilli bacterium]|nr:cysteine--tRNA ligase [Bacilli bacterium]